ncbi:MAG: hypothetical protein ACT4QF_14140 [Sporichthyaceae bacterium]
MTAEPEAQLPIQLEETVRFEAPVDVTLSGEGLLDVAADLAVCRLRDGSAVFALTSSRTPRLAFALTEEQVAALRAVLGYRDEI